MDEYSGKHLPQIEYYYDGYIYPFIGHANLKTLVEWRASQNSSSNFSSYNKDARNTYFEHRRCMEQCIRILFSNPSSEFSLKELNKRRKKQQAEDEFKQNLQDKMMLDLVMKSIDRKSSE